MNLNIPSFQSTHILVIGDVMLDRYWHGITSRISPEAPVPVVHVKQHEERPGGAGNVACNIQTLGTQVTLIGVTGKDDSADTIFTHLTAKGIQCAFIQLADVHTITKLRVLSRHQQLIRLDFEDGFTTLNPQSVQDQMQTYLDAVDAIILSDYGKGVLADPLTLIRLARAANKPILVDPKGNDFSKYQGATIITPNMAEFEAIVGTCATQSQLIEKGQALRERLELEALLITQSQHGMTLLQQGHSALHLPAHTHEVFDVTGAGDTVIGVLAASKAAGQNWISATALANLAAGIAVTKLGAATVDIAELEYTLHQHHGEGVYDTTTLKTAVKAAQANGETVVMTNGCFDILHAGHIQYLTQARQLGDRLIVAVNDDDSVRCLKGNTRPINTLEKRLTVLNALECVDWVIPFSEETPKNLICQILPDILVKGGDYQINQIAGSDCVLANGGQVLTLDFLEGCSTTDIIAALQHVTTKEKEDL
ncbi:bifunctional D-glycero-beta-D-manno-heptose-7-phosphate kinase/D-glycero-beta-D-manno-heptose 1-phosphate adenylyltransferase HldE [Candidatus Parabeggiatoa sp. HSG14]|uniref:bifunctional D-glycero-beta-D-manno-heptose-7-phosphate kinase/D-glycero-beta-D-manno-heptose 1-phosphate adenylyltransferase HldE n=1 Tax=Candidatus Parabeggiatoa sp. HSG14 TaxID=3055593 RepID=UPI0025A735F4|nr:bifunctional D-glycero-beta-D-manno-heptose-7-phosphate kinase/D-glycero-beta-D-manno-heptose 1-phosphate adenylyltransferase HldE [Thiotrichales bacterium HSG14]